MMMNCPMIILVVSTLFWYVVHNIIKGQKFQDPLMYQPSDLKRNKILHYWCQLYSIILVASNILTESEICNGVKLCWISTQEIPSNYFILLPFCVEPPVIYALFQDLCEKYPHIISNRLWTCWYCMKCACHGRTMWVL